MNDCKNVQCKQVHELLDSFMALFGRMGSPNQVSATKAAIVCDEIRKLEATIDQLRAEVEGWRKEVAGTASGATFITIKNIREENAKLKSELSQEIHASHSLQFALDELRTLIANQDATGGVLRSDLQAHKARIKELEAKLGQ